MFENENISQKIEMPRNQRDMICNDMERASDETINVLLTGFRGSTWSF